MPQKKLGERIRRAKRAGTAVAVKPADVGMAPGESPHAEKGDDVVMVTEGLDRSVSRKAAPGEGKSRRKKLTLEQAHAYERRRPENRMPDVATRPPQTTLRGRKKAPSQMRVKRKGGPRKKARLQGEFEKLPDRMR